MKKSSPRSLRANIHHYSLHRVFEGDGNQAALIRTAKPEFVRFMFSVFHGDSQLSRLPNNFFPLYKIQLHGLYHKSEFLMFCNETVNTVYVFIKMVREKRFSKDFLNICKQ